MRILIFLLLSFLFFTACSNERMKSQKAISKLEKQMDENKDVQLAGDLIRSYLLYGVNYPHDQEVIGRYAYRAAGLQVELNQLSQAINTLISALKNNFSSSYTPKNALLLEAVYRSKMKDKVSSTTILQALAQAFPENEEVKEKLQTLEAGAPTLNERLENMQQNIFADSSGVINFQTANYFVHSCELFAMLNPNDPESPAWLHKAAEIARSTRKTPRALELYDWIYSKYPDYEKASQALFLKGFILDEELKREEEARAAYELFLQRYPDDGFADDAQFLLDNLGKNDEEIINSFMEKE